jgi:hypothetical protein
VDGVGEWRTRADYDAWCRRNMVAFNRLSVTDPDAWERTVQQIEAFLARMKKAELV